MHLLPPPDPRIARVVGRKPDSAPNGPGTTRSITRQRSRRRLRARRTRGTKVIDIDSTAQADMNLPSTAPQARPLTGAPRVLYLSVRKERELRPYAWSRGLGARSEGGSPIAFPLPDRGRFGQRKRAKSEGWQHYPLVPAAPESGDFRGAPLEGEGKGRRRLPHPLSPLPEVEGLHAEEGAESERFIRACSRPVGTLFRTPYTSGARGAAIRTSSLSRRLSLSA